MVTILHIQSNSTWSFLNAHKSAAQAVQRSALVVEMLRNIEVTRFVASLLLASAKDGNAHRTLVSFHTGILLDYIAQSKTMDSNTMAPLLMAVVDSMKAVSGAGERAGLAKDIVVRFLFLLRVSLSECLPSLSCLATSCCLPSLKSAT
jgi:U3 small nucleolar RNA-associated protein 10